MVETRAVHVAVLVAVAALTSAARLDATSVVAKSFRSISVEAEQIFAGTVLETRGYRTESGHIWTVVRFGDLTWFAGGSEAETELSFAGGTVGDRSQIVGGMPRFSVGQRVLLFVRDRGTISPIVGFHQGCFGLERANTGEVVMTVDKRPVMSVKGGELVTGDLGDAGDADVAMSLDQLMREVAQLREAAGVDVREARGIE